MIFSIFILYILTIRNTYKKYTFEESALNQLQDNYEACQRIISRYRAVLINDHRKKYALYTRIFYDEFEEVIYSGFTYEMNKLYNTLEIEPIYNEQKEIVLDKTLEHFKNFVTDVTLKLDIG